MAGNRQRDETQKPRERVGPSLGLRSSRASKAAGSNDITRVRKVKMEQRANVPSSRSSPRSTPKASTRVKAAPAKPKKSPVPRSHRPSAKAAASPDPRDIRFISWVVDKWLSMDSREHQRIYSLALLLVSLLLFASLTVFRAQPFFSWLDLFFLAFFGWSSYLLALGLVAFACAQFIESLGNKEFVRWSMIGGLSFLWLLLLLESRLILGPQRAGALAEFLIIPFLGWTGPIMHIVLIGAMLITITLTFRITFGHVLLVFNALQRFFSDPDRQHAPSRNDRPSPYLGQRPQFSRYAASKSKAGTPPNRSFPQEPPPSSGSSRVPRRRALIADQEDEDVDFDAEFDVEEDHDDPLNDIYVHPQTVKHLAQGAHSPTALDHQEHHKATRGARQQALAFEGDDDLTSTPPGPKSAPKQSPDMEPLAPNPRRIIQETSAQPSVKANSRTAKAPAVVAQPESSWALPKLTLLNNADSAKLQLYSEDTSALAKLIQDTLRSFRVDAEVRPEDISIGPTVIRFGIRPTGKPEMRQDEKTGKMIPVVDANGQIVYESRTRVSRIMALQNDLALVMEAKTIRMEAPVPGRPYVGVEIPNKNSRLVTLREVLESKEYEAARKKSKLTVALGRDVAGMVRVGDLARMPHLLIAGATGAGKSVIINVIIASIVSQASPDDVRMLMVDPKMVELNMYNGIPHLLSPVVIEVDKVVSLLKNAIREMEQRYRLFSQLGVRNLDGYRKMRAEKLAHNDESLSNLPAIVIIIDELADLMMAAPEEVEGMICRLAQLARATGIHLVIATQRPSVDVITGLIKANIPTRISFMVSSAVDSRTIIDMGGAERLLGRGDMLYLPADAGRPERIQGAFLSDDEAQALADYWRQQILERASLVGEAPEQQSEIEPGWELKEVPASEDIALEDDLIDKAEEVVREYGRASISLLQRRLRVGYSRAARLIDLLEQRGIIGQSESGGRAREVYESNPGQRLEHGGGHSLADAVADIVAEERARDEFLRKQAAQYQQQSDSLPEK